jgi:hypothetical protein
LSSLIRILCERKTKTPDALHAPGVIACLVGYQVTSWWLSLEDSCPYLLVGD